MRDERIKSFRTKPYRCAACGKEMDAATGASVGSPPPADGDLSVCAYCGAVLIFEINDEDLKVRVAMEIDLADLDENLRRQLLIAQRAAADFRRNRRDD